MIAKYYISLHEMTRDDTTTPREEALIGGGSFETASRKLVSVLFLALGGKARKMLQDAQPTLRISEVSVETFSGNLVFSS